MGNTCCGGQRFRFKDYVVDIYPTSDQLKRGEKSPDTPDLNALGKLKDYIKTNPERIPRICRKLRKLMVSHIERGEVLRVNLGLYILKSLVGDATTIAELDYFAAPSIDIIEMAFQFANLMTIAEADRQRIEVERLAAAFQAKDGASGVASDDDLAAPEMFPLPHKGKSSPSATLDDEGQMEYRIGAADVLAALTYQLHKVASSAEGLNRLDSGAFDAAGAASRRILTDAANTLLRPTIRLSAEGLGSNDVVALHYRYSSVVIVGNYASCIGARLTPMMGEILPIVLANFLFSLRFLKYSARKSKTSNTNRVGGQYGVNLTYFHCGGTSESVLSKVELCKSVILPMKADQKDDAFLRASAAALHHLSLCPTDAEVLSFCRGVSDFCFRTQAWRQPFVLEHLFKVVAAALLARSSLSSGASGAGFVLVQHLCDDVCRQFIAIDDRASLCGALIAIQVVLLECKQSSANTPHPQVVIKSGTSQPRIVFELVLSLLSRLSTYATIDWADRAAGFEKLASHLRSPSPTAHSSNVVVSPPASSLAFPGAEQQNRPQVRAKIVTPVRPPSSHELGNDETDSTLLSPAASVRQMLFSPGRDAKGRTALRRTVSPGTSSKPVVLFEVVMGVLSALAQSTATTNNSGAESPSILLDFVESLVINASTVPSRAALCGHLEALSLLAPTVRRCSSKEVRQRIGLLELVFPLLGKLDDSVWDSAMNCALGYLRLLPNERDLIDKRVQGRYGKSDAPEARESRREAAQIRAAAGGLGTKVEKQPSVASLAAKDCLEAILRVNSPQIAPLPLEAAMCYIQSKGVVQSDGLGLAQEDVEVFWEIISALLLVSNNDSNQMLNESDFPTIALKHTPHTLEMTSALVTAFIQLTAEKSLALVLPLALSIDAGFAQEPDVHETYSPALRQCLCHVAISIINAVALTLNIPGLHEYCKGIVVQRSKSDHVPRVASLDKIISHQLQPAAAPNKKSLPPPLAPSLLVSGGRATLVSQPQFGIWFSNQLSGVYEPLQASIRATVEHEDTVLSDETSGSQVTTLLSMREVLGHLGIDDGVFSILGLIRSDPTVWVGRVLTPTHQYIIRSLLQASPESATALLLATSYYDEDRESDVAEQHGEEAAANSGDVNSLPVTENGEKGRGVTALIKRVFKGGGRQEEATSPSLGTTPPPTSAQQQQYPRIEWDSIMKERAPMIVATPPHTLLGGMDMGSTTTTSPSMAIVPNSNNVPTANLVLSSLNCSWRGSHKSLDSANTIQLKMVSGASELSVRCTALLLSMGLSRATRSRSSISDSPFYLSSQFCAPDGRPMPIEVLTRYWAHCLGAGCGSPFVAPIPPSIPSSTVAAVQSEITTFPALCTSVHNYVLRRGKASTRTEVVLLTTRDDDLPGEANVSGVSSSVGFLNTEFSTVFRESRDNSTTLRGTMRANLAPGGQRGGLGRFGAASSRQLTPQQNSTTAAGWRLAVERFQRAA